MGSTRLPGKVMKIIESNNTVLSYVISQLKNCKTLDKIIIATTTLNEDDVIFDYAKKEGIDCFRGSSDDVLDRHYQCAEKFSCTDTSTYKKTNSLCKCLKKYPELLKPEKTEYYR